MPEGKAKHLEDAARVIDGRVAVLKAEIARDQARDPQAPSLPADRAAVAEAQHCARLIRKLAAGHTEAIHTRLLTTDGPMADLHDFKQVGRLAMRVEIRREGPFWVGYYALPDTMEGAIRLGEIAMKGVEDEARRTGFMGLMQEMVADILEDRLGIRPEFNIPDAAPEHERTGRPPDRKGRTQ